ncbi:MAG: OpgC domain-containing protein [Hyphomonadaceae bacterium]|nr:OpgC domain-containing protein [Hyphomonadaceae bacterium]
MRIDATRSFALDLARGLCLILMVVDHLPQSPFFRFSNINFGPLGFFSGASAFVLISGVVSAKAYGSILLRDGAEAAWRRVLKRMAQIYAVNAGIFLLLFVGVSTHVLQGQVWRHEVSLFFTDPGAALALGLLMIYRPGFLDILPMYLLFLLLVIPALQAIRAGRARQVLALSFLAWLWAQLDIPHAVALNPLGYQLLFVVGLVIGATAISEALRSTAFKRIAQAAIAVAVVLLVLRGAVGFLGLSGASLLPEWRHLLTNSANNGALRVVSFAVVALSAVYLWPRMPASLKQHNAAARWVSFLGRHSLPVFSWSILMTYLSMAVMPPHSSPAWRALDMLLVISSLAIPAFIDHWMKKAKRANIGRATALATNDTTGA